MHKGALLRNKKIVTMKFAGKWMKLVKKIMPSEVTLRSRKTNHTYHTLFHKQAQLQIFCSVFNLKHKWKPGK